MAIVAIIPARFGSTRLPGKPLSDIHGKPMIQHVHERVSLARGLDRVLVATDDERIASAVAAFGGEAVMTSSRHATGTDRLAEAVARTDATIVVNVQGDEPQVDPAGIEAALRPLREDALVSMSTLSLPLTDLEEMLSPAVVKVVADAAGDALYFSRSPIPHVRQGPGGDARSAAAQAVAKGLARRHVGLYVYRREALLRMAALPVAPLEEAEGLEQLRALHHGIRIRVVPVAGGGGLAVDTPQDLERVRALMAPAGRPPQK
ncbi:MAG TPA: 3-deoxy-manno-octulosonate cytidylyltransferase [Vicinamibacteria bacterium]|nr:3-deoxy-manno-octulosonate cytidylyltransferase [Vicinamibacteria bacterium]